MKNRIEREVGKYFQGSSKVAMTMTLPTAYLAIAFFLSLSSLLFSTSNAVTVDFTEINHPQFQNHQICSNSDTNLECEIQDMNLKIARLEHLSEMTGQELDSKSLLIENCEMKIEELSRTIQHLESDLSNLKDVPDYEEMIKLLEEQVRELEAVVRRNDLNISQLKVRVKDDKRSVESLASKVELMAKIVPELWFHVQKLEQAREVIERRTGELRRHLRNERCLFFKFINKLPGRRYHDMLVAYSSEAINLLRRSYTAIKKYHHQISGFLVGFRIPMNFGFWFELQGFVRQKMEINDFTAVFASEELVFYLVSVVVVFPAILALRWLLSVFFSLASSVAVFMLTLALSMLSLVPFLVSALAVFYLLFALR